MGQADDIFGDKRFMEGDFEDGEIEDATKEWLNADIDRSDDPEVSQNK